jgi:hypothetical protein
MSVDDFGLNIPKENMKNESDFVPLTARKAKIKEMPVI